MKKLFVILLLWCIALMWITQVANTSGKRHVVSIPGKHTVVLSWTASTTPSVTYNVYRGAATGVCSGTPTPYVSGVTPTTFTDTSVTLGTTYFYAVSAVGSGGESTCTSEVQISVPTITTNPPTNLSGTVN